MKTVAVGIVLQDGLILACQRRRDDVYPLKWEFPGGKIEPGELPAAALQRELREELDIEASVGEEFHRQNWIYPQGASNPQGDGAFRVHYFLVDHFNGVPVNRVFEQIRWVTVREFSVLDILEGNRETVNLLLKHGLRKTIS